MNFIKEIDQYDMIYNAIQMKINYYETGNPGVTREFYVEHRGKPRILNNETKQTIWKLKKLQKKCNDKRID